MWHCGVFLVVSTTLRPLGLTLCTLHVAKFVLYPIFLLASSTYNIHLAHYAGLPFLADVLLVVGVCVRRDNADATDNISPTAF
jgi:hypothetical protein